jgi:hypothetical protein
MKEYPPDVVLRKLLKVIDYLLDFVEWPRKNKIFAYYLDHAEVAFFELLDDRLYYFSVTAGLSDKLPDHRLLEPTLYAPESHRPAVFVGSTHLPGDWDPDPSGQEDVFWAVLPNWKKEMLRFRLLVETLVRTSEQDNRRKRTGGRPRKTETPGSQLVLSALKVHHGYETGGAITNYSPASIPDLVELSGKSDATVSRYLKSKFGNDGYGKYVATCTQDKIGLKLALWSGDLRDEHFKAAVAEGNRILEDK